MELKNRAQKTRIVPLPDPQHNLRPGGAIGSSAKFTGALFKRRRQSANIEPDGVNPGILRHVSRGAGGSAGRNTLAFAGVYLFTLLLYARPNDLIPGLGNFPLVKILAIGVLVVYVLAKASTGEKLSVWTLEMTMLVTIAALGIILAPISSSPKDGIDMLTEVYLKTVIIFILMVNLIDSRERLYSLWKLVVVCGAVLAFGAINSYMKGEFTDKGLRIEGLVGGMFENANDLATALDILLPFAISLTLAKKGLSRLLFIACSVSMAVGVLMTLSRGGFLGLMASGAFLIWKLGRGRRFKTLFCAALIGGILFISMPGGYGARISTIFNNDEDQTGSAQLRRQLMERAADVAISHPLFGVGMGNFHIYSIREKEAHNAYLEIAAELGFIGLLAYMIVILAPLRSLIRIERHINVERSKSDLEIYRLSVVIQAALIAYMVCSFFASIQYLWYLYYTAAYGVALRQIHAAEQRESSTATHLANYQTQRIGAL